jgi:hypothetical protein
MAAYSYPDTRTFQTAGLEWGLRQNVIMNTSKFSGSTERIELPGSRWFSTLTFAECPAVMEEEAAEREAYWAKIGGPANLVQLWHLRRPYPRGTMRGSPVLSGAVAQGATVLPITTTAGATLKYADMVKAGGMLFMVTAPATANGSGAMSVSVTPPARLPALSGAAVEWDRPYGLFMPTGEIRIGYQPGGTQSRFSVDLVEVW